MCFVCIDLERQEAHYLNAGHPGIYMVNDSGIRAVLRGGSILGTSDNPQFGVKSIAIERDDVLIFITDGIFENRNRQGQCIRRRDFLQSIKMSYPQPVKIIREISHLVDQTHTPDYFEDDVTVLALRICDFAHGAGKMVG